MGSGGDTYDQRLAETIRERKTIPACDPGALSAKVTLQEVGRHVIFDEEADLAEARLRELRPLCFPGAVFMADDRATGRTRKSVLRPTLVVVPPSMDGTAAEVLQRRVIISTRSSWKPHLFPLPVGDEEVFDLLNEGIVFTDAGVLARFTKPGFFELARREGITLGNLDPSSFAGWLPRPYVEWIILRLTGRPMKVPYPPAA